MSSFYWLNSYLFQSSWALFTLEKRKKIQHLEDSGIIWEPEREKQCFGIGISSHLWEVVLGSRPSVSSVQLLSRVRLFVTPRTAACQASLSIANSWSLLKLMSIELVMPSNHLILFYSILLLSSIFLSIRVFSNESVLRIRWLNYWSFSFSISPSNAYSGLISFRMDWLDLLAVQGHRWYHPILLCLLLASSLFVDFL